MKREKIIIYFIKICNMRLLIGLLLLSFSATAQITYNKPFGGYSYKYLKADSAMSLPFRDTAFGRSVTRPGEIVCNASDSFLYYFNGIKWKPVIIDSGGVITLLNRKVDSVTSSGANLFYWVNGVSHGFSNSTVSDAQNGLTDSVNRITLGGALYKDTYTSGGGNLSSENGFNLSYGGVIDPTIPLFGQSYLGLPTPIKNYSLVANHNINMSAWDSIYIGYPGTSTSSATQITGGLGFINMDGTSSYFYHAIGSLNGLYVGAHRTVVQANDSLLFKTRNAGNIIFSSGNIGVTGPGIISVPSSAGTPAGNILTVTGATGGASSGSGAVASGGKGGGLTLNAGSGGATTGAPTSGVGGAGGDVQITGGQGGFGSTIAGTGGFAVLQGGTGGTVGGGGATSPAGYAAIKGGNAGVTGNGDGANVYIVAGAKNGSGVDGNILLGVSPANVIRGNVGIKTISPDSTLHVVGGLKFVTGSQGSGKVLTSDANGGADWKTTVTPTVSALFTNSATKTVTNTVTETTIIGSGSGSLVLPANYLTSGRQLRILIGGIYSTPAITPGTLTIKIKLGSTVIASGTASGLLTSATNAAFSGSAKIVCLTTGAAGSLVIDGSVNYSVGNNLARFVLDLNNTGNSVTLDTTASQTLDVTVTWDTANASKSVTGTQVSVEVVN